VALRPGAQEAHAVRAGAVSDVPGNGQGQVDEQDIVTGLTALMALASYLWRLLSEQKLWTVERWFYLIVSWAVFTYSTLRFMRHLGG
jgi:hypothetical protein